MLVAPKPGVLLHPTWTRRISEFTGRLAPPPKLHLFPLKRKCPPLPFASSHWPVLVRVCDLPSSVESF